MRRSLIALAVFALCAADSQACFFGRVRERIAERRQARSVTSAARFVLPGIPTSPIIRTPSLDCPDGRCPLRKPVSQVQPSAPTAVAFEFPRRMP